ncbi:MAG: 3-oxoacyl-ACP synthase III [Bacteriovoracaceae bacterium]|nr:3-oxoacyl-ACP synthase III [Bacteriovoracaceae bacterium]
MKFNSVALRSWGYEEPAHFKSSDEIEMELSSIYERLKLPAGRLELQTGIKRRGYWPRGERPSSIATLAAKKAIGNFPKEDIGLLIHASVCRDFLEPATASMVHHNLGLSSRCALFDLSNACLGVISATMMAASQIEAGVIKAALIVSGENSGPLLLKTLEILKNDTSISRQSIKKYIASLTIGSAGVAFLLTHESLAIGCPKILGGHTLTDSSAVELCQGSGTLEDLVMETDSEALMKAGVALARATWDEFQSEFPRPKKIIAHQVGSTHRRGFQEALNVLDLPDFMTFPEYGNTGSAALPLTFMKAHEANFFAAHDTVAFAGIGSGLTSSMLFLEMP